MTQPKTPPSYSRTSQHRSLDYVAYLHVTGAIPTHLRRDGNQQIRRHLATRPDGSPVEPMRLRAGAFEELGLAAHPLVWRVGQFEDIGFRVNLPRGSNARRCFDRVRMTRGNQVVHVMINGAFWTDDVSMFEAPAETWKRRTEIIPPARHRERPRGGLVSATPPPT
ncbi:MAG: hypothetical protein K2X07_03885 [Caulobacteraceae bacterium]|nr:hypothetical protein [Caulobacteraceae bacterium]